MRARKFVSAGPVSLCLLGGASLFAILVIALSVPVPVAWGAAPEAPAIGVEAPVKASEATFRGVLNPGKEGRPGTYEFGAYQFLYKASKTGECEGGSVAPASPGVSLGAGMEVVMEAVASLASGTEYAVCLRVETTGGATVSPAAVFTTVISPETPSGEEAKPVTATAATLKGVLNPGAMGSPGRYEFFYRRSASGCQGEGQQGTPETHMLGGREEAAQATVSELLPNTRYTFCLRAINEAGEEAVGTPTSFTTLTEPPKIEEESASDVTSVSTTLNAAIDPENNTTSYYFQYGTSAAYGSSVPAAPGAELGSGTSDLGVDVHLQGLAVSTVYHYRVVAVGELEGRLVTVEGPDETFSTQAAGTAFTLPDGRAWELVTPPDKQGAAVIALGRGEGDDIQAAQDGDGITYGATAPIVANSAGSRSLEVTQAISLRVAPGVWSTRDIVTPHNEGAAEVAVGHSAEYKLFSSDLSLGLVEPAGDTPLPPLPEGSEKTVYLREAGGEYEALVTSSNVPAGCKFGGNGKAAGGVQFVDGTPDMSHVILSTDENFGPVCLSPGIYGGTYEWYEGRLRLINVLPDGEVAGGGLAGVRGAISNDGSRVIWSSEKALYLRDMVREETVPIAEEATFQAGDGEDSKVFFTASDGSLDVFEVTSGNGEPLAGKVTQLTEGGAVDGVIGTGEDGSDVYFVSGGVLGDGAEHGAENGGDNLYVEPYDETTKAWAPPTFIALLSSEDMPTWSPQGGLGRMTSRVSRNGRYLAFMSERSLTGYDNHDANSGVPDEEVFLYDADTRHLACVSCNPTGARPVGLFGGEGAFEEHLVDEPETWKDRWFAANAPGWTTEELNGAVYQSRYLSDSGRLFFDSSDALVPADVNGKADVYEYEPAGVGSCKPPGYGQSASDVFVEGVGGCVALISAGTSGEESVLMDASEDGGDVFFLTLSRLSPQDVDTSLDIYDAHECTTSAPCVPSPTVAPPPCTTADSCKPSPSPQPAVFGAPASETFKGAGNVVPATTTSAVTGRSLTRAQRLAKALKVCGKRSKRKRAACQRQARKRYGARSTRVGKSVSIGTER